MDDSRKAILCGLVAIILIIMHTLISSTNHQTLMEAVLANNRTIQDMLIATDRYQRTVDSQWRYFNERLHELEQKLEAEEKAK